MSNVILLSILIGYAFLAETAAPGPHEQTMTVSGKVRNIRSSKGEKGFKTCPGLKGPISKCRDCGKMKDADSVSVIDGREVYPQHRYPWVVGLMKSDEEDIFCGATIVSPNYIMTAGHCVRTTSDIQKQLSAKECKANNGSTIPCFLSPKELMIKFLDNTTVKSVAKVIPHPKYKVPATENDIALIKLTNPIKCSEYKNPICLPPSGKHKKHPLGTNMMITGWGATEKQGISEKLKEARISVVSMKECKKVGISNSQATIYCVSGKGKQGPCFGDSGGSMFTTRGTKRSYAAGVASTHTSTSCDTNSPAVYTSVGYYADWIYNTTGLQPCKRASRKGKSN